MARALATEVNVILNLGVLGRLELALGNLEAAAGYLRRWNKEIAAELFMGGSTVESHPSRVYRKLGIRSRAALPDRIAIRADEPAEV
jgi:Bacterial regulatory proteins, luxR family